VSSFLDGLQHRLIPALLAALGATCIAAGILWYSGPVDATPPSPVPSATIAPSSAPTALLTLPPLVSPSPPGSGAPTAVHVATRVVVAALGIDLPVIREATDSTFPPCNVAMYFGLLHQPGEPGATYLYAHARTGMFLSILTASQVNNGARMIGMLVQVYTSDDRLYLYEVVEVRRHVLTLDAALAETSETLWLQTSEGPRLPTGQVGPKVQLIATPLSNGPADPTEAHPKAAPVNCG
jgi:hypothetical protein